MEDLPLVPVVYFHKLVEMMHEEHIDADYVLKKSGVSVNLFNRVDTLLTMRQARAIVSLYKGLSHHGSPGLRFGRRLDLHSHSLLGYVLLWQGNMRGLMTGIVNFLQVRFPLMRFELLEKEDYFSVMMDADPRSGPEGIFFIQSFIGSMHMLASSVVRHITLHCRSGLFDDMRHARQLLDISIETGHHCNELRFHTHAVNSHRPATSTLESADPGYQPDPFECHGLVMHLRHLCMENIKNNLSAEDAAARLNISVRTLRRRLADVGLSFNTIRLDMRMQVANRYLSTTDISIERIASLVAYSDQATFTRAYRQWCGNTPHVVRSQRARQLVTTSD